MFNIEIPLSFCVAQLCSYIHVSKLHAARHVSGLEPFSSLNLNRAPAGIFHTEHLSEGMNTEAHTFSLSWDPKAFFQGNPVWTLGPLCVFSLEMSVTRHRHSLILTINRSFLSFPLDVVIVTVIVTVIVPVTLRSFDHLKHSVFRSNLESMWFSLYFALTLHSLDTLFKLVCLANILHQEFFAFDRILCPVSLQMLIWFWSYFFSSFEKLVYIPLNQQTIAACDDIIRQHKTACLRVTSMLICKDLLWIGTSAGVILTLPLPHLTLQTCKLETPPVVTGM